MKNFKKEFENLTIKELYEIAKENNFLDYRIFIPHMVIEEDYDWDENSFLTNYEERTNIFSVETNDEEKICNLFSDSD